MKRFLAVILLSLVVLSSGCGQMFKGEKGDTGVSLIKTYSGVLTGSTMQTINVPEIKAIPDATYVMAYSSFATSPSIWTPISDGWLDSLAMCYEVSWDTGKIFIYQGFAGNNYMIKVYRNN